VRTIQFEADGYVFTVSGELVTKTCPACGVIYAMPEEFDTWCRKKSHRNFYCPAGHQLHYPGKSEEQKLREANEALARERARHDQTQAQLRAQKAQTTRARNERDKIKTRVAHGVCPCCNRTFKQLAAHMQRKHPEFVAAT
jgi:3'-phosphoadenosine 5'-phosphosulfate (PAPS) 3'-phosphatase